MTHVIRTAEELPKPVRTMLCDTLVRTFNTYKEERHAFQNSTSALVGTILKTAQGRLQNEIQESEQKKSALDTEAATMSAASDAAAAASDAAANALANSKTAVADSKTALKNAKAHLHNLESETKTAEVDAAAAATKKGKLEAVVNDFIPQVKAGTKHGDAAGRHIGKDVAFCVDSEFLTCVTRTFSKRPSSWGTFDNIVDQRLDANIKHTITSLTSDIAKMATDKETRAANVDAAKGAIVSAEEVEKIVEDALTASAAAAKEAETAAKAAKATLSAAAQQVQKAALVCKRAEDELAAFTTGALAAYSELEARAAPPPEPEPAQSAQVPEAPAAPVAAAMAPAPAVPAARPSILSSPQVLYQQARSMLSSPAVASSPRASQ